MSRGSSPGNRAALYALLTSSFLASAAAPAVALDQYPGDTAIYGVSTASIQPNVLVILDNSGSMSETIVAGDPYNPATVYPQTNGCQGQPCETDRVYRWRAIEGKWVRYITDVNTVACASARNGLMTTGTYQGRLSATTGACSGTSGSYATGNYINWLTASGGYRSKMDVAKEVLTNLVSTTSGVRFGLMIFNMSNGGHIAGVGDGYGWNGYDAYVTDMDAVFTGATTNRTALINTIGNIAPSTWTPLAETLFEAKEYFSGARTAFNGSYAYASPIQYSCQKNYVILITDGMSTEDRSPVLQTICNNGDCDGDGFEPAGDPSKSYSFQGSDYLDDVAKHLYDTDLLPDSATDPRSPGKQNVITYTIGFGLAGVASAEKLLQETAYNGGGVYYSAASTGGLSESLRQIIASILEVNTSFVAPVLPVSPENRAYSGNRIYMGFFKPRPGAFWSGNIKKYGIDSSGDIVDRYGNPATNPDGSIRDNAVSYWGASADGPEVESGGAGAKLLTRTSPRDVYTYTGSTPDLLDASNAFSPANTAVTAAMLGAADAVERAKLMNFVLGYDAYDAYDADSNGITTEKRGWIMGDILHSRPVLVNYTRFSAAEENNCSLNRSLVFVGGNGGMLHAINDCDGSEEWAFVPPDLLGSLKHLPASTHTYYVDSSPAVYAYDADADGNIEPVDGDRAVVLFGERRGGGYYYALDVSDPSAPKYLWRISSTESPSGVNTDYSELAETWSEPVIARVLVDSGGTLAPKVVAFVGAGYDNMAEDQLPPASSTMGRGIYAVEIATLSAGGAPDFTASGRKVWGYTYAQNPALTRSVPAQLSVVDINGNGYADRVYAGDMAGGVWRFDIGGYLTSGWTGRKVFQSNPGADSSTGRKIFYRPSVTLEPGYELLFFATGDREHPTSMTVADRLYAVKDTGQMVPRAEGDLADATTAATVNIAPTYGWYVKLGGNPGEKALANPTVINRTALYTTYTPPGAISGEICSADNRGTARFYALKYLTAAPMYNYDLTNDTGGAVTIAPSDRSTVIGTGIPSGMVTVISPGGISAIVGSGGSLVTPPISGGGGVIPTYWREVR